jgi:formylglycine-generating enzyme required for sulfatase activity
MLAGLDAFLVALRSRGLQVGAIEVERLRHLFSLAPDLEEPTLRELLASTLVKDHELRAAFDEEFAWWFDQALEEPNAGERRLGARERPRRVAFVPVEPRKARRARRAVWMIAAAGALGLAAAALWSALHQPGSTVTRGAPIVVPPGPGSAASLEDRFVPVPLTEKLETWVPEVPPETVSLAKWSAGGLAFLAALAASVLWLLHHRRTSLPAPAELPHEGPEWLPLLPVREAGLQVFSSDDARQMVWGVGRFVSEDVTGRIDVPRTVACTARAAGIPVIVPEHEVRQREVWIWEDVQSNEPSLSRLSWEVEAILVRAGLPVRRGHFSGVPHLVHWSEGDEFSPVVLEGCRQSAIVLVLTDGAGLKRSLESGAERPWTRNLLRSLAEWPRIAFVDMGRAARQLALRLRSYRVPCLRPEEVAAFIGTVSVRRGAVREEPRAPRGDLRPWEAAACLAPAAVDEPTAQALRRSLGLGLSALAVDSLYAWDAAPGSAVSHGERQRCERLNWLMDAEPAGSDGSLHPHSTLARALAFWRERLARERRERASRESPLSPWLGTLAEQRLRLEEALLDLFDKPGEAARSLHALSGGPLRDEVRRRTARWTGRDAAVTGSRPRDGSSLVLPWTWQSLGASDPQAVWILAKLGLGKDLGRGKLARKVRMAPRLIAALGVLVGLGAGALTFVVVPEGQKPLGTDPMRMVELPGGPFLMGSSDSDGAAIADEQPQHRVTVSPFAMAKLVVTRKLYRDVMGKEPTEWTEDRKERKSDDDLPATDLSWFDAVDFCIELSKRAGLAPPYLRQGDQVEWDRNAGGYRLPTEAEWEYAARAGTTTRWWWGDEEEERGEHAWFLDNYSGDRLPQVSVVEAAMVNRFGLHGMAGNVFQWCWDWYAGKYYGTSPPEDPAGPEVGGARVVRGGSVRTVYLELRFACRESDQPMYPRGDYGFRCVRAPRRQS